MALSEHLEVGSCLPFFVITLIPREQMRLLPQWFHLCMGYSSEAILIKLCLRFYTKWLRTGKRKLHTVKNILIYKTVTLLSHPYQLVIIIQGKTILLITQKFLLRLKVAVSHRYKHETKTYKYNYIQVNISPIKSLPINFKSHCWTSHSEFQWILGWGYSVHLYCVILDYLPDGISVQDVPPNKGYDY